MTEEGNGQTNLTMWFKREAGAPRHVQLWQAYHAVPIMVNLWGNARMRLLGHGPKFPLRDSSLLRTFRHGAEHGAGRLVHLQSMRLDSFRTGHQPSIAKVAAVGAGGDVWR